MHISQKGLTFIELAVVIAIAAIMAALALPNMGQWIASRRAANGAEQVANLLRFARSEAVRLNLPVYVCPVQIKKDGNPDQYCNTQYSGQGMAAFADSNDDQAYDRDSDIALRFIILNVNNEAARVAHQISTVNFGGTQTSSDQVWAFLPNGAFGHASALSGNFSYADGYLKIALTDADATTIAQKQARASVVLVDSGGRVEVCAKTDQRSQCQYSE